MALVFTGFPGIWQKLIKNTTPSSETNDNQAISIFSLSKVSDGAFSIVANITGHSGLLHILLFKKLKFIIMIFKERFIYYLHSLTRKVLGPTV